MELLSEKKWDEAAQDYQHTFQLGQNDYNRAIFSFWQDTGMLRPGCRVLDVGCGVGKYGVMFAGLGCDVTLTDISGRMLELAGKNMTAANARFLTYRCDFNDVDGSEDAFKDGFDFSISTMSPAVNNVDTVKKFSGMTHGWCFLTRFAAWHQPDRSELLELLGAEQNTRMTGMQEDCDNITACVRLAGYTPSVTMVDYNWHDSRTAAEQAAYMRRNYSDVLSGITDERLLAAAEDLCGSDGLFTDRVNTRVAWIYWRTENEQH